MQIRFLNSDSPNTEGIIRYLRHHHLFMKNKSDVITEQQIKLFFTVLAFVTQSNDLFEELLIDLPVQERAKVLLAGTIIENCGLSKIKSKLQSSAISFVTTKENWMPIRNQYIINDHVWLFPVIRACDPNGSIFSPQKSNVVLIESISADLGIRIKIEQNTIQVELSRVFKLICQSQVYARGLGFSDKTIDPVFLNIFDEKGLCCMKLHTGLDVPSSAPPVTQPHYGPKHEMSSAILFLVILVAIFVTTGLVAGCQYSGSKPLQSLH
ncbi:hypothetical protein DASB73_037170 [Starmerella bacillaris]|uniref:Uncharacterized protein n=1 Tax=Starmerella bacillaris TaxID=1247836 RepID=A0AAV5RML1_STABA|nr:hypothetical protein DASB73_037170 [Starmerella bacillaris]